MAFACACSVTNVGHITTRFVFNHCGLADRVNDVITVRSNCHRDGCADAGIGQSMIISTGGPVWSKVGINIA